MIGQSQMSLPTMCEDTSESTGLRASADGTSRYKSQGGVTRRYGPGHVPVSRFRCLDNERAMPTNDTSGPLFTASSPSAGLQRFLESRLLARMDRNGSPLFELTWSTLDMPAGLPICVLRASRRSTLANDCSLWRTPAARDWRDLSHTGIEYAAQRRRHQPSTVTLAYQRGYVSSQVPALLCGLMGYPDQWIRCAPSETPSSRKSRRNSSERSSIPEAELFGSL